MAVRIQREVGGNLAELLLTVADTMTARQRLRGEVSALTAEGRISAIVLGILPVGLGAVLFVINPGYMNVLLNDTLGRIMLGIACFSALIGFAWMKKIINIDI
jgi:tight adherence protein B